jgi:ElaB/YqjD/DUF883 family membrane-anchored ribosome-binding protein
MTAAPVDPTEEAAASTDGGADQAGRALREALAAAEKGMGEAARIAERVIREGVDRLRAQTKGYSGPVGESMEDVQRYLVERIKERPVTAAFAGVGIGLLLGLLLSSRGK